MGLVFVWFSVVVVWSQGGFLDVKGEGKDRLFSPTQE